MIRPPLSLAVGVLFLCTSCNGKAQDALDPTVLELQKRTCPEGGTVGAYDGVKRTPHTAEAGWVMETPQDWETYRRWVAGRLAGYEPTTSAPSEAVFTKGLSGDTHSLRIERIQPGPPLRVRITFQAHPD